MMLSPCIETLSHGNGVLQFHVDGAIVKRARHTKG
jgi:hypothetical protein